LARARALGTRLIVGINSDESVRMIRGENRPFVTAADRAAVLQALESVDEVRVFNELTPERLIEEIAPDVLVKGGDWPENEIIGASFVRSRGGEVYSLELKAGYSSTNIVEAIRQNGSGAVTSAVRPDSIALQSLKQHIETFEQVSTILPVIESTAARIVETFAAGKKILICGNGGSAADAQHLAAEFVGRYEAERKGLPAIALTTDTSALTALANDYSFDRVFARQVEALAKDDDLLIAISTSGSSPNVIEAVMAARNLGCGVIGMTGAKGKKLASLSDECILVPSTRTARIQEVHITVAHIWCEILDHNLTSEAHS
jgi:D-sedoheptulose 7-phosphate isomerase